MKIGSWLARQLTTWYTLPEGQQQMLTALSLTPRRTRSPHRAFEQTVPLELFPYRESRNPAARESIRVDGESVRIGAWLAKARTKHRTTGLPDEHVSLSSPCSRGTGRPRTPCRPWLE
ncbi:hypothetical protein [Streptomyces sp. NPDC015414]|uniref:hypothetical protein n=1 Tax=Streptomyces sp. NPDC015414 TaxID=3364957 RepID=UPI0036FD567F